MNTTSPIAFIGLEMEGVILRKHSRVNGVKPNMEYVARASDIANIWMHDGGKPCLDTYDCLAEVRTEPLQLFKQERVQDFAYKAGNVLFHQMSALDLWASSKGAEIYWDEMMIPGSIHEQIMNDVRFKRREIRNALTNKTFKKETASFSSDLWRGGGMHINISFPWSLEEADASVLAHDMATCVECPTGGRLPHLSKYRAPGQYCIVEYELDNRRVRGIEYRSTCFSFTPLGIIHVYHVLEATISVIHGFLNRRKCLFA